MSTTAKHTAMCTRRIKDASYKYPIKKPIASSAIVLFQEAEDKLSSPRELDIRLSR